MTDMQFGPIGDFIPKWSLDQLNLLDLGNTIQVAGVIYADAEVAYVAMLPKESLDTRAMRALELTREDWDKIVDQMDKLQTEILEQSSDGTLAKVIIRKSTRTISQHVSWAVYRRDGFACRYCGADDVPLTVDHLVLWEEGGPSIEDNLVAADRRCNKARGNMQYDEWLKSPYYRRVSQNLTEAEREANLALLAALDGIPRLVHRRKKR
jgi:hypothetical protein